MTGFLAQSPRFSLLALLVVLCGCQTIGTYTEEYISIEPEQAKLEIIDEFSELPFERYAAADGFVYEEVWVLRGEPRAELNALMLTNERIWTAPKNESGFISSLRQFDFNYLKGRVDYSRIVPRRVATSAGFGWYFIQDTGDQHCMVSMIWSQQNYDDADGRFRNLLKGYFCQTDPIPSQMAVTWIKSVDFGDPYYDGFGIPDAPLPEV